MKYSFEMALAFMKQGIEMRRPEWPEHYRMRVHKGALLLIREGADVLGWPNIDKGALPHSAILATDWEKYE